MYGFEDRRSLLVNSCAVLGNHLPQYSGASTLKYTSFPRFMGDTFVCTSVSVGQNRVSLWGVQNRVSLGGGGGGGGGT